MAGEQAPDLNKAYRNGWILIILATIAVVLFFTFVFTLNYPGKPETWDMGGHSFVPASSNEATGWYSPVNPAYAVSPEEGQR